MTIRLLPLISALVIAGCSTAQRQAMTPVGAPFAGTWHFANATSANEPAGFLAIDAERVLFNLDGLPRGAVGVSGNETDAGLRSGRLVCEDGRVLYLAVGDSLTSRDTADGRLLTPTQHLDVHIFAPSANASDQPQKVMRLWPTAALAVAALPATRGEPPLAVPARKPPATRSPTDVFTDTLARLRDPFFGSIGERLAGARHAGMTITELDALYRRATQVVRSEALRDLEAARRGERDALARADLRLADLAEADRAYGMWRDQP